jgi:hypothetical protein
MFDRRQFLIGAAGSLLTTAFVRKAKIFSLRNDEPLLTPPVRKAEETLFINSGIRDDGSWRLRWVQSTSKPLRPRHGASIWRASAFPSGPRKTCGAPATRAAWSP